MAQRLRFNTARDLFQAFPAALDDMAARPSDRGSLEFIKDLVAGPTPEDAITFCAYLLGRREAVWWGHQCLSMLPDKLAPEDLAVARARRGLGAPARGGNAHSALEAGMASPTKTPGVWIALAAGWSGGSMIGPGCGAGGAAALSDGKGGQCRRARRAGAGRPEGPGRDAGSVRRHGYPACHEGVSQRCSFVTLPCKNPVRS